MLTPRIWSLHWTCDHSVERPIERRSIVRRQLLDIVVREEIRFGLDDSGQKTDQVLYTGA